MSETVFISYPRIHKAEVEVFESSLRAAGVSVFRDVDIPPGTKWKSQIDAALARSQAVHFFWCCHAAQSHWIKDEIDQIRAGGKKVIPYLFCNENLPHYIADFQAIDCTDAIVHLCCADHATRRADAERRTANVVKLSVWAGAHGDLFTETTNLRAVWENIIDRYRWGIVVKMSELFCLVGGCLAFATAGIIVDNVRDWRIMATIFSAAIAIALVSEAILAFRRWGQWAKIRRLGSSASKSAILIAIGNLSRLPRAPLQPESDWSSGGKEVGEVSGDASAPGGSGCGCLIIVVLVAVVAVVLALIL